MADSNTRDALTRARSTGQPVPIKGGSGLVAYPNGSVGTPGGGFGGSRAATLPLPIVSSAPPPASAQSVAPSAPFTAAGVAGLPGSPSGSAVAAPTSLLQRPSLITNVPVGGNTGLFTPTTGPVGSTITAPSVVPYTGVDVGMGSPASVQAPLNQANPNFTAGIQGAVGTQSGQPVHATYDQPQAPDTKTAARTYRAQHGLATADDTDALNAESLAAAQAGRTYFNPTLAAQYGQPLTASVSGPRTDVVNALTMPTGSQTVVAQQQPIQVAQNNLLAQGIY